MEGEGQQLSKNAQKKLEKERKKEEAKKQRAAEREAKKPAGEAAAPKDASLGVLYGERPVIRSETRERRAFTDVREIGAGVGEGAKVLLRGRVDSATGKGNMSFVVLRQRVFTLQCVICKSETVPKDMVKFAQELSAESIIDVEGQLVKAEQTVESCTVKLLELRVEKLFVVSKAQILPVQVADCSVPTPLLQQQKAELNRIQAEIEKTTDEKEIARLTEEKAKATHYVKVARKMRLDNRIIDLRTRANNAIFRIQSGVCTLFREFLLQQDFVEIHSPKILPGASEGGANVFELPYFGQTASLAQSPQFYKQYGIASDLGRGVFEIGPVFRAEKHNTNRHLCEFTGLDMEMSIYEHYHEATDVIGQMFCYIFDNIPKRFAAELAAVNDQYPFTPLRYSNPPLRFTYPDIIKILRDSGEQIGDFDDLSTEQETKLGILIGKSHGVDFYWCDRYPAEVRPFYTMEAPDDPRYTNAYDWFVRGWEIVSGSQRIHEADLLIARAQKKGMDPAKVKDYIDAFRYGCAPHAGCGVGLERIVMLYLGLKNIRMSSMFPRDPKRLAP